MTEYCGNTEYYKAVRKSPGHAITMYNIKHYLNITVSFILIIVCIICVVLWTHYGPKENRSSEQPDRKELIASSGLCLPCNLLNEKPNSLLMEKLDKLTEGNVEKCCAKSAEQISVFMGMLMTPAKDQDQESLPVYNAENFSLSRASAHKHLEYLFMNGNKDPEFENGNINLHFDINPFTTFGEHVKNIDIMISVMVVKITGRYFIYSSIFFKFDIDHPCKSFKKQIWEHNIVLTKNNDEHSEPIFKSTLTCCDDCIEHKETSYAGGLFDLQENDRLHVEVTSVDIVRFSKEGSYFGLFMLT